MLTVNDFRPHRWTRCVPGNRADLAVEDRDLKREANDLDGCITSAFAVRFEMYPPINLAPGVRVDPMLN